MAYLSIDPALLQRVRLEIAAQADGPPRLEGLADVGRDRLRVHIERLFYGGEVAAECSVAGGLLQLVVRRLTPYGVLALHARLARDPSMRRDA
ncbi:MAG: hypothetical protein Q7J32_01525 [Sphingomonadaceae bacterium]|nr:hypothetical protein [Sphingomonadaceae bacterium]